MERQAFIRSATLRGIEAVPVMVEVSIGNGLPGFIIVGMPDAAVSESRERVRLALRAAGFSMPDSKIVVNLSPASLRKTGTGLDLPIAVGILRASGQVGPIAVEDALLVGELSLDGRLRMPRGLLAYARCAEEQGLALMCPIIEGEVSVIEGVEYRCLESLGSLHDGVFHEPSWSQGKASRDRLDYSEIAGQDLAKRALQLAAAGGLGLFMIGPPGSGKTMLAQRLPTILPPLEPGELVESAVIHSILGAEYGALLEGRRPFRAPHHSSTRAGLLGGGHPIMPGEVSLAHNGVLFLDEMPEFGTSLLQMLRQPVEEGQVVLARAEGTVCFPARFMLLGAANPCPCGYYGDPCKPCMCTEPQVSAYQARIGGPLMDRFDLCIDVWRSDPSSVLATGTGKGSAKMKEEVMAAREFAKERGKAAGLDDLGTDEALLRSCGLDGVTQRLLESLARRTQLSGRGIMRVLKVARVIADMAGSTRVLPEHLEESVMFRVRVGGVS